MNQEQTVAILLAVYNGEKHLDALLHSLLEQDYPFTEIHVRDNCSTDGTVGILHEWQKRYPTKIRLHFSTQNVGIIGNFGLLLELTEAPYLMFCDGDDVWKNDKVSKSLAKIKELELAHGQNFPLLVHTDLTVVDENLKVIAPSFWAYSRLNTTESCRHLSRLLVQNHVTGCTVIINHSLKNLAMPIPLNCVMHDWWFALVAACFGKVSVLNEPTLYYRQHSSNDTGAKPYSLAACIHRKRGDVTNGKIQQAELLLKRFGAKMSGQNCLILKDYLLMQKSNFPRRLQLMFQHGFFKSGFLRNFILNH